MNKTNLISGSYPKYLLSILVVVILTSSVAAHAKKVRVDGTFIQPMLCGFWTDAEWQREISALKEAGMHYIVIGTAAECAPGKAIKVIYPSNLPGTERASGRGGKVYPDIIENCLRNAEVAGMKVFVGIGINESWWKEKIDSVWLYKQMEFNNKVGDELWNLYKKKYPNAFYGWYWTYEIANFDYTNNTLDVIAAAMNIQLDHLLASNEKLPFMWCPYMNAKIGTPEKYEQMWKYIFKRLHTTAGDIFAPQDCIGAGGLTLNELDAWFSALRKAVDTKPELKFWSDVETFDHTDWSSATIGRIVKQLKIEKPYVDNYITFAYSHYQSPTVADSGYQKTYVDYLRNGKLENVPPSQPGNLKAEIIYNNNVRLTWSASTDNIGICGYYIYRNGVKIAKRQKHLMYGRKGRVSHILTFTDRKYRAHTKYTYRVQSYDFADYVSPFSQSVSIITK